MSRTSATEKELINLFYFHSGVTQRVNESTGTTHHQTLYITALSHPYVAVLTKHKQLL